MTHREWLEAGRPERRKGQRRWREWLGLGALLTPLLIVAAVAVFAAFRAVQVSDAVDREAQMRTAQFCRVEMGRQGDREQRLTNTKLYLATKEGHKRTGLNDYIRKASLPQLEKEVQRERKRIPPVCLK